MHLTINQSRRIRQGISFLVIGTLGGLLYVVLEGTAGVRYSVINALTIGFLLSLVLMSFELIWFRRQNRRIRFILLFILRIFVYFLASLLIPWLVIIVSRMRRFDIAFDEVLTHPEYIDFVNRGNLIYITLYAFAIMATVNFTRQMSRKLGQGMLLAYLTGRYRHPVREDRFVMFLRIKCSDLILSRIGARDFYTFLNDVIYDITEPIIQYSGNIIQYVEDEIVIIWSPKKGTHNANCINVFFDIQRKLKTVKEDYFNSYGFVPGLRASLHYGSLIRSEVGIVRTEISAIGDILNTTSRMMDETAADQVDFCVSKNVLEQIELPDIFTVEEIGSTQLRGKSEDISLYTIRKISHAAV